MRTFYTTIIHSSQLMTNIDTMLLNSRIYLDFISFPLTWPRILSNTHIKSESCLLQAPLAVTVTQTSLVLDDSDVSRSTAQRYSRTLLKWGPGFWGRGPQRWLTVSSHQGDALSTGISLISSLHHLAKVHFSGFFVNFYIYFPTPHSVISRRKSLCAAHTSDMGNDSAPPSQCLCLLLEISLQGNFFLIPYLFIH